ncbi:hypothetical protein ACL9RJ_10445 [Pseudomonas sp. Mn2068]|uniref:hypothetical protein n=1 Tax=Pseudomonas sp. Mn2068 TaxID=3395265 RepID=UPI003BBF8BAF
MNTPARTIHQIAHDALEDLGSAQVVLGKLESLLYAALADKGTSQHIRNLVDIAWNLAADGANTADCDHEAITHALNSCEAIGLGSPMTFFTFADNPAVTPASYQDCVLYNPCEGYFVATYKEVDGQQGFYKFGEYEALCHTLIHRWAPLPDFQAAGGDQ